MPDELEVGRIGRAHGVRGEVAVSFTSNRPERYAAGAVLHTADGRELVVVSSRPHQGRRLVCFEGITDRGAAESLLGAVVTAAPLGDVLDDREHWVHELIGARVALVDGTDVGCVVAVEANPAHDQLVLDSGALVPMVFVTAHDRDHVVVDVPDGLFDL